MRETVTLELEKEGEKEEIDRFMFSDAEDHTCAFSRQWRTRREAEDANDHHTL